MGTGLGISGSGGSFLDPGTAGDDVVSLDVAPEIFSNNTWNWGSAKMNILTICIWC